MVSSVVNYAHSWLQLQKILQEYTIVLIWGGAIVYNAMPMSVVSTAVRM